MHRIAILGVSALLMAATTQAADAVNQVGVISHLAWGGGWQTVMFLNNHGQSTAHIVVNTYDDNGSPMGIPWANIFNGPGTLNGSTSVSTLDFTLAAGSVAVMQASSSADIGSTAWASVASDVTTVVGGANFKYQAEGMNGEAWVDLEGNTTKTRQVMFFSESKGADCDNAYEFASYAVVNMTAAPVVVTRTVTDVLNGVQKYQQQLTLPAHGHTAFLASDLVAQGPTDSQPSRVWLMQVAAPAANQVSVLSLHFRQQTSCSSGNGNLIFESMPSWQLP